MRWIDSQDLKNCSSSFFVAMIAIGDVVFSVN